MSKILTYLCGFSHAKEILQITFSHPDSHCRLRNLTGSAFRLAGSTAGRDFHPALKIMLFRFRFLLSYTIIVAPIIGTVKK